MGRPLILPSGWNGVKVVPAVPHGGPGAFGVAGAVAVQLPPETDSGSLVSLPGEKVCIRPYAAAVQVAMHSP